MAKRFEIVAGPHNRWTAPISEDITVGIKVLSETDSRRIEKGIHGYAVLDINTSCGPIRIRDVKIVWSRENERFFLRWRQWRTGFAHDGRPEWLDVAGPQDRTTRLKIEELIVELFSQIREEAALGTLGRNPELRGKLESLQAELAEKAVDA